MMVAVLQWSVLGDTKYTCWATVTLRCIKFKVDLAQVICLDSGGRKSPSCTLGHSEVTWCTHCSCASATWNMFSVNYLWLNMEGGSLSRIRNCENWTIKHELGNFIAKTRKIKCKYKEKVKLQRHNNPFKFKIIVMDIYIGPWEECINLWRTQNRGA